MESQDSSADLSESCRLKIEALTERNLFLEKDRREWMSREKELEFKVAIMTETIRSLENKLANMRTEQEAVELQNKQLRAMKKRLRKESNKLKKRLDAWPNKQNNNTQTSVCVPFIPDHLL